MVHFTTPYSSEKKLGKAYNDAMKLIPDGDHNCIRDIDTIFLLPEQPAIIEEYVKLYPNAVLTGYCNRLSPLSRHQLLGETVSEDGDIRHHIALAKNQIQRHQVTKSVREIPRDISGFLMVVPKTLWQKVPFPETGLCLGVDTEWNRLVRAAGFKILRMDAIYLFHIYRMWSNIYDKDHLK